MFDSLAFALGGAPGGTQASGSEMFMQFVPLILMFVIFWFLLIRPQQKRSKEHKKMLSELKRGDYVLSSAGLIGRILEIDDETVLIECGESKLRLSRVAIGGLFDPKAKSAAPAPASKEEKKDQ